MAGSNAMATYEVIMPSDYLHILNCICVYKVNKTYKCYNKGDYWRAPATRLTADMYSQVLDNFWNKPTYKKPYYYIHNVNTVNDKELEGGAIEYATTPTNPYTIFEENTEQSESSSEQSQSTSNDTQTGLVSRISEKENQIMSKRSDIEQRKTQFSIVDQNINPQTQVIRVITLEDAQKKGIIINDESRQSQCFDYRKFPVSSSIASEISTDFTGAIQTCNDNEQIHDPEIDSVNSLREAVYQIDDLEQEINNLESEITVLNLQLENKRLKALLNNDTSKKGRFKGTDSSRQLDYIGEGSDENIYGMDGNGIPIAQGTGLPKYIKIGEINGKDTYVSNVERGQALRYGNTSEVRLEIRYGTDNSVFELIRVYVDYIKAPQNIRLTQREIDLTEDTSQMLEYPDYVCQEIVNELVHLIMENTSDGRLQTHPVVTQSIANPAQQQTTAQEA